MSLKTPCSDGVNNPDDWYIGRDGKQYTDDDLLTDEVRQAILDEANRQELTGEPRIEFIEKSQDRFEGDAKRENLRRRRKAREKCHDGCYFRLTCLDLALRNVETHGIWGGYTEEELRELRREISRRERRQQGAANGTQEQSGEEVEGPGTPEPQEA
jgi:hypothetical protein